MEGLAARRWWPLAAGVLLGVLVGLVVSLAASTSRRAEASVLVSSPAGPSTVRPLLPNLRELATSSVVAGNVRSTLRLTGSTEDVRRRLHATVRPQAEVIAISATDEDGDKARQLAQEAAVVFAQLVGLRFGKSTPKLQAAVLDSAHVLSGPDRHFLRNGLVGALVGLLLGSAAGFVLAGGAPAPETRDLRKREHALARRLKGVTARERSLADHAGKLAARERELEQRAAAVTAQQSEVAGREPEPRTGAETLPLEAAAVPAPARSRQPGGWNVENLQRAVGLQTDATPEQLEEWRTYLFFLREHAAPDGSLPSQFDGLVEDVFAAVADRARPE